MLACESISLLHAKIMADPSTDVPTSDTCLALVPWKPPIDWSCVHDPNNMSQNSSAPRELDEFLVDLLRHVSFTKFLTVYTDKDNKGKIDVNSKDEQGYTLLHHAAAQGNARKVSGLLWIKADPNAGIKEGRETPLRRAILFGRIEAVEVLLQYGANPNDMTYFPGGKRDTTSLHEACDQHIYCGNPAIVSCLLESKANPNTLNYFDDTPLHKCIHSHDEDRMLPVIDMLIKAGAYVYGMPVNGDTCKHLAKRKKLNDGFIRKLEEYEDQQLIRLEETRKTKEQGQA